MIDLTNPKAKCKLLADTSPQWGSVGGFVQNQPLICGGFDGRNVIQGDQILRLPEKKYAMMLANSGFFVFHFLKNQRSDPWTINFRFLNFDRLRV